MSIILKSPAEIEAMKEAGRLSAAVLREVGARCVPGVSTLELDQFAEDYIRSHGGVPTFKGYGGFPGSICASINEQIVHGIPSSAVKLKSGDIISIDVGATVDGWAGDNAWTYAVGKVSPQVKKLLERTLFRRPVREIGSAISGMRCKRSPGAAALAWCATIPGMALGAICTRIRWFRITG